MIYSIDPSKYPQAEMLIEELVYQDLNEAEWRIARSTQGFVVKYCGNPEFKGEDFNCEILPKQFIKIKNTGTVIFFSTDLESFWEMRNVLMGNNTDVIWEIFKALFSKRFQVFPIVWLSELA